MPATDTAFTSMSSFRIFCTDRHIAQVAKGKRLWALTNISFNEKRQVVGDRLPIPLDELMSRRRA